MVHLVISKCTKNFNACVQPLYAHYTIVNLYFCRRSRCLCRCSFLSPLVMVVTHFHIESKRATGMALRNSQCGREACVFGVKTH